VPFGPYDQVPATAPPVPAPLHPVVLITRVSPTFIVTLDAPVLGEQVTDLSVVAAKLAIGNKPVIKSERGARAKAILFDRFMTSSVF